MFERINQAVIADFLSWSPAVGILGARQVGKTTLAKTFANDPEKGIYLDLDSPQAMAMPAPFLKPIASVWSCSTRFKTSLKYCNCCAAKSTLIAVPVDF
jgi:hypothetical protein